MSKLERLLEIEGIESKDILASSALLDGACPGICMNKGCDYTTEVEPDQDAGYCENCGTRSVKSGLVLLGII